MVWTDQMELLETRYVETISRIFMCLMTIHLNMIYFKL